MAEIEKNFEANTNQKCYDMVHCVDHLVDVTNIYFAEKIRKYKWTLKEEIYPVKNGGKILDVRKKYEKKLKDAKTIYRNLETNPNHTNALKPKDEIKLTWEEREDEGFEFNKIGKIRIGKKVYIVANCIGNQAKLTIAINENKLSNDAFLSENPIKFLIGDEEKDKIEFAISKDKIQYDQEIFLRPKSDDDLKKIVDKFRTRTEKKGFLFLKGEVTETQDEIKFPDETKEFRNKDNDRFEVYNVEAPWMELAWTEEAKKLEETGTNKEIQKFFEGTAHYSGMQAKTTNEKEVSWCAAFVNWIMVKNGYLGITTDSGYDAARALKWSNWDEGKDLKKPVYGAIAVKTRSGGGHVGFVAGIKNGEVVILGGNQGQKLKSATYSITDYFAYLVPKNYEVIDSDYVLTEFTGNPDKKGTEN